MPTSLSRPARSGLSGCLRWLPVFYLLLAQFPGARDAARPSLDGSWVIGVNELVGSPYHFGADVVYTYGPLGFLLAPLPMGHNLAWAQLFWVATYALFFWAIWRLRRRVLSDRIFWLFALLLTTAMALTIGLVGEHRLLALFALVLVLAGEETGPWWPPLVLGAVTATFFFMKTSLGAAALLMALGVVAVELLHNWRPASRRLLLAAAGFAAAFAGWSALLLGSLPALVRWVHSCRDIAGDYSVAQSVVGKPEILVLGVLGLAVMERLVEGSFFARAWLTVPVSLGALFALKQGFTRQDRHVLGFFPFLLALVAILYVCAEDGRRRRQAVIGFCCVLALSLVTLAEYDRDSLRPAAGYMAGRGGIGNLISLFRMRTVGNQLAAQGERQLWPSRLDPRKVERIQAEKGKVGVMPWEISLVPANHLDWQPTWVLQSYVAHTVWLDHENAASISGAKAPLWMLLAYDDVDGRNLLQSVPLTMRAVLETYQLAEGVDRAGWLLLRKRGLPEPLALKPLSNARVFPKAWCEVPWRDSLVFVSVDMRLNVLGRAARLFFRVPPVLLECQLEDGSLYASRLIPGTAASGIPIGCVIRSAQELEGLFLGRLGPRVLRFRITGDGVRYYRSAILLNWMEATGKVGQATAGLSNGLEGMPTGFDRQ